jgi:hypothetical protein
MNTINQLRFAISDRINDVDISPRHVSFALLNEFQRDVGEFLKGSGRDVELGKLIVAIEPGSLALRVIGLLAASTLWADIEHLKSADTLNLIDSKRASVVERWQAAALKNPHRLYSVADQSGRVFFAVNSTSNFRRQEDAWVHVEKYLYGTVVDLGGSTKANVHLKLENGGVLIITSTHDLLAQEKHNRLYRPALLHITTEENLLTGELRNLNLLAFEEHKPSFDEDEFNSMVARGTQAWTDVPDATAWLETLRGIQA